MRLTVIDAEPLEDEQQATSWLATVRNRAVADDEVAAALLLANRLVHAHRLAAHDAYEHELSRAGAYRIRLGWGTGNQVAESSWAEARVVPTGPESGPRRPRVDPEPGVAEILGGRKPEFMADDLVLRAQLDLDQGRFRQAAVQAAAAARTLSGEPGLPDEARSYTDRAEPLAQAALKTDLDGGQLEQLEQLVASMRRDVRRRMHSG